MKITIITIIQLIINNLAIIDAVRPFGITLRHEDMFIFYAKPWWLMGKAIYLRGDVHHYITEVNSNPTVKKLRWLFDKNYQLTFEESWAMHQEEGIK